MKDLKKYKAQCLCGAVKAIVAEINPQYTVCHCEMCRKWGGGPLFAMQCGTDVKFEGIDRIERYKSSDWATRGFCKSCGTHLFYQLKNTGSYNMPVGLFNSIENLTMDMQYFSDKRPQHYCFSNETNEMTESEIMTYFSSQK
jgi:hypothetical protein